MTSGAQARKQNIHWTFTNQKFFCEVADSDDVWLCDFYGNYELTNKIILSDTVVADQTCDRNDIPVGQFYLYKKYDPDSLIITQYVEPPVDVEKIISLARM